MRIVVGMSGATGAIYGIRLLEYLRKTDVESHLVISQWAAETIKYETGLMPDDVYKLADYHYAADNMAAAISSGSFHHDGMVILPCSMKTLACISNGISDNLIARAADVTIKERRPLVLSVRETPLSPIHLENMLKLSRIGVCIMPPVPNFYSLPHSLDDIVDSYVGRVLDHLKIQNNMYHAWNGENI